jgi:hypothetical protein
MLGEVDSRVESSDNIYDKNKKKIKPSVQENQTTRTPNKRYLVCWGLYLMRWPKEPNEKAREIRHL